MPFSFGGGGGGGGFGELAGAVSDIFASQGDAASAKAYQQAADLSKQNAQLSEQSTRLQEYQANRQITQTIGAQQAQVGGAGFQSSGTATNLLRSSIQQGELTKQLVQVNGQVQTNGYQKEAVTYQGQADAARAASQGALIGGIFKAVGAVASFASFSDIRLKNNIVYSQPSHIAGIALYTFHYNGSETLYEGVLAQEVRHVRPDCVEVTRDGLLKVDYDKLGIELRIAGGA